MERIGILLDDVYRLHDAGAGHPERPSRLQAITAALESTSLLQSVRRIMPEPISDADLFRLHSPDYVHRIERACATMQPIIDEPDCGIGVESYRVARLAAGGVIGAARSIMEGGIRRAFCAVRPPGHHAERAHAMGFCLFGNVALAAAYLRDVHDLRRIAIIDWDVHHGNGTQHLLEGDPCTLFVSLHGDPRQLYPGTGFETETGTGDGEGFTLNVPLAAGTDDAIYESAFRTRVLPRLREFKPEFVLISSGFDAHAEDPLGNLSLSDHAFSWLTDQVIEIADEFAGGRVLSVLEGGYNLAVLRRCIPDHVSRLEGTT